MLQGLTSDDYQLVLPTILRRAETLYQNQEIVTRRPDKSFHRYTYVDFIARAKKFALALKDLGVEPGDRVGTLCSNHYQHLETYFGVPSGGAVIHTINPRLHEDDLAYIVNHAEDKVLLVDEALLSVYESFREEVNVEHVIVVSESGEDIPDGMLSYEDVLSGADEGDFSYPKIDEKQAAAMCYTSGTTGRPKGALYSHRALVLHAMMANMSNVFGFNDSDCILPIVPMFHVNAWGLPFSATLAGAKQMMPGAHLDPASILEDFEQEKVTFTAGVPTVFMGVLQTLDEEPEKHDLSAMRAIVIGGSAAPKSLIEAYKERHGVTVIHAWGMTEMSPIGTVANLKGELEQLPEEEQLEYRSKQGYPVPFIEIRAREDEGSLVPWNDEAMGELEVSGPWVSKAYYNAPEEDEEFTEDGWFKTGDIVSIDEQGYINIQDRDKDLVKSGGEWISSVQLENALMAHAAVAEAAVIAIPHEKWDERPLAVVVLKEGESATEDDLKSHLAGDFAKFWLPDAVEFIEEIPKTATGKFLKKELREQFEDYQFAQS